MFSHSVRQRRNLFVGELASHAEVQHVDLAQFVEVSASDGVVARLHITMQVADAMQVLEGFQTLDARTEGRAQRHVTAWALLAQVLQRSCSGYGSHAWRDLPTNVMTT